MACASACIFVLLCTLESYIITIRGCKAQCGSHFTVTNLSAAEIELVEVGSTLLVLKDGGQRDARDLGQETQVQLAEL